MVTTVPTSLPRLCSMWLLRAEPERCGLGNAGKKRSFSAKRAGVLVLRHVSGCSNLRKPEKNTEREDFRGANHLCVDNGRNRSVQP